MADLSLGFPLVQMPLWSLFVSAHSSRIGCSAGKVGSGYACSEPHEAYAAFTHGLISKWTFRSGNFEKHLLKLGQTTRNDY